MTGSPAQATAAPIKLGVYVASQGQVGAPEDAQVLDNYAAMVGRKPDIVMDYSNITDPLLTPVEISNLQARGETPMVTWQLFKSGWSGATIPLQDIAAGNYDSNLRQAADLARSLPFDVMIRFGHEMNGNWYGWSGNPSAYVDTWRHVVTVFRQEGASNVKWVWAPNVDNGSYPFAAYFPGDSYVDYVGLDGYNWGTAGTGVNKWQSLSQVFSSSYGQLTQMSTKPVIITEISASEIGGNKASWITNGFLHTIPEQFPRVQAVIWFDRNQEEDWRIDSSTASLSAYQQVVSSSLYGGTDPAPAVTPSPVVQTLQVTLPPTVTSTRNRKTKQRSRAVDRRARVFYRLSRRAAVRIALHPRHSRADAVFTVTIKHPKRRGYVRLSRLVHGHSLHRGAYRVVATALGSNGSTSRPRHAGFRIVSRGRA